MKKIRTVKGDIAPSQMGITTMHDHTISDFTEMHAKTKARMTHIPAEKRRYIPENLHFSTMVGQYCAKTIFSKQ